MTSVNSKSEASAASLVAHGMIAAIGTPNRLKSTFDRLGISPEDVLRRDLQGASASLWIAPSIPGLNLYSVAEKGDWIVAAFGYFYCELHGLEAEPRWTQVNTEEIAHRLSQEGPDCLQSLDGAYFLVALDASTGEVYAKSDPGGTRRMFQFTSDDVCLLSNKLHLLSRISERAENTIARNFYLIYGYHPVDYTMYRDVKRLPGTNVFQLAGREMAVRPSPSPGSPSKHTATDFDAAITQLYSAMKLSMEAQLHGKRRVAVLLGGFDSSLVASLAKRMGLEVETFSFYYDDQSFNQTHTDTLADYLGIKHNWIHITQDLVSRGLKQYNKLFDQPTNWANYPIQTAFLTAEIQKRGFETILTGDGCDGAFYGYPGVYKSYRMVDRPWRLPEPLVKALTRTIAALRLEEIGGHPVRVFLRLLRTMAQKFPARIFFMFRFMDETSIGKLLNTPYSEIEAEIARLEADIFSRVPALSLPAIAYMGKNAAAPSKTKLAGCSDYCGLPAFSPYMHPQVLSVTKTFPDDWLRPTNPNARETELGKHILVRMTQQYELLPDSIIFQRKLSAVDAPVDNWYHNELKQQVETMLETLPFSHSKSYIHTLLRPKWTEALYSKYLSSDSLTSHALMLLVTYSTYFTRRE